MEGTHLDRAEPGHRVLGGHFDRLVKIRALEDVETSDLLLGLRERAVGDDNLAVLEANRDGALAASSTGASSCPRRRTPRPSISATHAWQSGPIVLLSSWESSIVLSGQPRNT